MRLLVVEDDDGIAAPLVTGLRREGFEVERAATGAEALAAPEPDLVLLDLRLPDMDGYDVARGMRARSRVPIIMVTARGEEVDRVVGLELGADDYVVKPFGLRELIARINAVMRRVSEPPVGAAEPEPVVEVDGLAIDRRRHEVTLDGAPVALTPKEFALLALLAGDPGAALDRRRILEEVWGTRWYGPSKTIDVHISSLRRKLGDPGWIETVRGVGFRLRAP
ncbi:response regulator transcription factor [Miltoncostaea oceani]|jgi:two-component system, OmpR family, response regulator RegX3|uniref:response regulator transcription factor n=1 Tax=Miltoncostaea oceani TaxID=2843216 RepID=UPI001C3C2978|nr:response regulator transcription factor [Miltoncostaea oceani]